MFDTLEKNQPIQVYSVNPLVQRGSYGIYDPEEKKLALAAIEHKLYALILMAILVFLAYLYPWAKTAWGYVFGFGWLQ